jgi:hypothetical protein
MRSKCVAGRFAYLGDRLRCSCDGRRSCSSGRAVKEEPEGAGLGIELGVRGLLWGVVAGLDNGAVAVVALRC